MKAFEVRLKESLAEGGMLERGFLYIPERDFLVGGYGGERPWPENCEFYRGKGQAKREIASTKEKIKRAIEDPSDPQRRESGYYIISAEVFERDASWEETGILSCPGNKMLERYRTNP